MNQEPIPLEQDDPELGRLMAWYANLTPEQRKKLGGLDTVEREAPKTGRNDPCHCGSGKKYKKCCMA